MKILAIGELNLFGKQAMMSKPFPNKGFARPRIEGWWRFAEKRKDVS
jgi:hypothetical protein